MTKEERREYNRKYYQTHKEQRKEYDRKRYQAHKEQKKEYSREYYQTHKGERKEYDKEYRQVHKEQIKKYCQSHKKEHAESNKHWKERNPDKVREMRRKSNNKHYRNLGFNPLNEWFEGCEGHHINTKDVIYIPKEMHKSVPHCLRTRQGMAKINTLAIRFYLKQLKKGGGNNAEEKTEACGNY